MLKYVAAASALKFFSATPPTRKLYRQLGNTLGQKKRLGSGIRQMYVERAKEILELCEKHHAIQPGDRIMEIGTGWVHRESTIIRLFYDVRVTLFDVWDNRQLAAYKNFFSNFEQVMGKELNLTPAQSERAHTLLKGILAAQSFEEIYALLDFEYVINPAGTLEQLPDGAFSLIFSCSVLEHVSKQILPEFIQSYARLLKPGGYSIHLIDLQDHLSYYDRQAPIKNYLRYSDRVWKRYFQNEVQYFNRVQRSEWLNLYSRAGFVLEEERPTFGDLGSITINPGYKHLDQRDLECLTLWAVHRKPDASPV